MLESVVDLFITPRVDFVDYSDGLLVFKARRKLSPDVTHVKLRLSFGTVTAQVVLEAFDEATCVYRANLLNCEILRDKLDTELRSEVRVPGARRVSSPDLPQQWGITEDLSVGGARIFTSDPLEQGRCLKLTIELEAPESPAFAIDAEVRWTGRQVDGEGYQSGLQFVNLDPQTRTVLETYLNQRVAAEGRLPPSQDG